MGLFSLWLAACQKIGLNNEFAIKHLKIGESTQMQVREKVGKPDSIQEEPGGEQLWEFPFGPEGIHTYRLRFDAQGVLQSLEQILTRETFSQIKPGMRQAEIRQRLGKPRTQVTYDLSQQEVWDWRFQDGATNTLLFVVTFDSQGVVLKTEEMASPEIQNGG